MAQQQTEQQTDECFDEENPNYKPPAKKSLDEIQSLDQDDESLKKYKEALLGKNVDVDVPCIFPDNPNNVIVQKLAFCSEGRPEVELNLTGELSDIEKKTFVVKEGSQYRMKISFYVQREIVTGLKYKQKIKKGPVTAQTYTFMVGSYGPKKEIQNHLTGLEDVPSGMLARGTYKVENKFIDDDGHTYLKMDFKLEIKKDWE